jgi:hypothetical protein
VDKKGEKGELEGGNKMRKTKVRTSGSIGVVGLLGVLFVGLKLTGHIDWSWIWVLAPFWAPFGMLLAVFVILIAVSAMSQLLR